MSKPTELEQIAAIYDSAPKYEAYKYYMFSRTKTMSATDAKKYRRIYARVRRLLEKFEKKLPPAE